MALHISIAKVLIFSAIAYLSPSKVVSFSILPTLKQEWRLKEIKNENPKQLFKQTSGALPRRAYELKAYDPQEDCFDHQNIHLESNFLNSKSRRNFFEKIPITLIGSIGMLTFNGKGAYATQPRNDALCATGFFTNIAQRMCTEIGDITEDGLRTSLTDKQTGITDSLLGKLDLDFDTATDSNKSGKEDDSANAQDKND